MLSEINWRKVNRRDIFVFAREGENASDHNIFLQGYGYLTDHIPAIQNRSNPNHWNQQFENAEAFSKAWHPRLGPLELVDNLAKNKKGPFSILNLGAGIGDFTADLGLIPNVFVTHVDFSEKANKIAKENAKKNKVEKKVKIRTTTNLEFLNECLKKSRAFDMVFLYGALADNTPLEKDVKEIIELAEKVLKPGGYLYYVGLAQPFLAGNGDHTATDILGEYPARTGIISDILDQLHNLKVVRAEIGNRPDKHPLIPGGESVDHMHVIQRALIVKKIGGQVPLTPDFSFKDPIDGSFSDKFKGYKFNN